MTKSTSQVTKLEDPAQTDAQAKVAQEAPAAEKEVPRHDDKKQFGFSGDGVRLILSGGPGIDGNQMAYFEINGYKFFVPRNTPVDVPVELVAHIQEGTKERHYTASMQDEKGLLPHTDVPRYMCSVLGKSRPAEEK